MNSTGWGLWRYGGSRPRSSFTSSAGGRVFTAVLPSLWTERARVGRGAMSCCGENCEDTRATLRLAGALCGCSRRQPTLRSRNGSRQRLNRCCRVRLRGRGRRRLNQNRRHENRWTKAVVGVAWGGGYFAVGVVWELSVRIAAVCRTRVHSECITSQLAHIRVTRCLSTGGESFDPERDSVGIPTSFASLVALVGDPC